MTQPLKRIQWIFLYAIAAFCGASVNYAAQGGQRHRSSQAIGKYFPNLPQCIPVTHIPGKHTKGEFWEFAGCTREPNMKSRPDSYEYQGFPDTETV